MVGIEKITGRILEDARKEAAQQKADAEAKCAALNRAADAEAEALKAKLITAADAEAEAHYGRLVAAMETENKKAILQKKQELVGVAFQKAIEAILNLDTEKYTAVLAKLAAAAAETKQEAVILNARDKKRCGKQLVEQANRLCGGALTLSSETRPIVGGLILSQGKVELNCALDTLAELKKGTLSAALSGRLLQ